MKGGIKDIMNSPIMGVVPIRVVGRHLFLANDQIAVDFSTCCYLGLDTDITVDDINTAKQHGLRNGWSRISGTSSLCLNLENSLAENLNFEAVRLAPSISLINLTVFKSLSYMFKHCLIDEDAHSTMKDGILASKLQTNTYSWKNNNLVDLTLKLKDLPLDEKKLIVVDGIYSMKGSLAPIDELLIIAKQFNAYIYIDDAHGFGVTGKNGFGVLDHYNIRQNSRVIYVGSFSKCTSNPIAFICSTNEITSLLDTTCSFLIYSGPPSNLHVATSLRHLQNFKNDRYNSLRSIIRGRSVYIHKECAVRELKVTSTSAVPFVTICFKRKNYNQIVEYLHGNNMTAKVAIFPVVRKGDEVIRLSLTALHTDDDIKMIIVLLDYLKGIQ